MNRARLERLILILEDVEKNNRYFDMSEWTTECGTASCAMGYAAVDPIFNLEGLSLYESYFGDALQYVPSYNGVIGYSAAVVFFEITMDDAEYLFAPSSYNEDGEYFEAEPKHVIARIRELLNR